MAQLLLIVSRTEPSRFTYGLRTDEVGNIDTHSKRRLQSLREARPRPAELDTGEESA